MMPTIANETTEEMCTKGAIIILTPIKAKIKANP